MKRIVGARMTATDLRGDRLMQEMRMLRLIRWKAELDYRGFASHSIGLAKGSLVFP